MRLSLDKETTRQDILGNKFGERYSLILTDPAFERKLHAYDPNLKLMFDQFTKRWVILVWREDNSGWQILMKCEDDFGNPMPVGDHIFNHLNWMRKRWEEAHPDGDRFYEKLLSQADENREKLERKISEENQYKIRHDINQWRKGFLELQNLPKSDAIAGYPKITNKPKGIICRPT